MWYVYGGLNLSPILQLQSETHTTPTRYIFKFQREEEKPNIALVF